MTSIRPPLRPKTRDVLNHHQDSTQWDEIVLREGDVICANWAKAGVTWLQQIVLQALHQGSEDFPVVSSTCWPDWWKTEPGVYKAWSEAIPTPRVFKTHLPADSLNISPVARYIYIGRDARDVCWSFYAHIMNYADELIARVNAAPHRDWVEDWGRPSVDVRTFYNRWIESDGQPYWPFWSNVQSWWDLRGLPNILLVHHQTLKDDLPGQVRRIAGLLGVQIEPAAWPRILEHCSFDWMKAHTDGLLFVDAFADKGASFINRGVNGRWRDVLTPAEIARADEVAALNLTLECAHWLKTGVEPAA